MSFVVRWKGEPCFLGALGAECTPRGWRENVRTFKEAHLFATVEEARAAIAKKWAEPCQFEVLEVTWGLVWYADGEKRCPAEPYLVTEPSSFTGSSWTNDRKKAKRFPTKADATALITQGWKKLCSTDSHARAVRFLKRVKP